MFGGRERKALRQVNGTASGDGSICFGFIVSLICPCGLAAVARNAQLNFWAHTGAVLIP